MLRSELARRGSAPRPVSPEPQVTATAGDAEGKPKRRTSTRKPAATEANAAATPSTDATSAFGAEAKPKRRTTTRAAATTEAASADATAEAKPKRRTSSGKAPSSEA